MQILCYLAINLELWKIRVSPRKVLEIVSENAEALYDHSDLQRHKYMLFRG